jgi:HD-like signal output (HDOD) protein
MQADLFNTIASQSTLPAASRAEAVQLLASLLHEVHQTPVRQPANVEVRDEQDQR